MIRKSLQPNESQTLNSSHNSTRPRLKKSMSSVEQNEDLIVAKEQFEKLKKKPGKSKPVPKRLRSTNDLHDGEVDSPVENSAERQESIPSTAATDIETFKLPNAPAPRKSKRRTNDMNSSDAVATVAAQHESLLGGRVVSIQLSPCDALVDSYQPTHHATGNDNVNANIDDNIDDNVNYDFDDDDIEFPMPTQNVQSEKKRNSNSKQKKNPQLKPKATATKKQRTSKAKVQDTGSEAQTEDLHNARSK